MVEVESGLLRSLRNSRTLRLAGIGALALLLLIPILRIGALVNERQGRAAEAAEEIAAKWGGAQELIGPALVVPYTEITEVPSGADPPAAVATEGTLVFLPRRLDIAGTLDSQVRRRGIFSVPVYRLDLQVDATFGPLDPAELGVDPAAADFSRAHLAMAVSDVRAVQEQTAVEFAGGSVPFLPGTGGLPGFEAGMHAPVAVDPSSGPSFRFPLVLNGSRSLAVAPFAETTVVDIDSDSPHPSFQGNWLPVERSIGSGGFEARWEIPFLGRNFPQAWTERADVADAIRGSLFGVDLVEPVDAYSMAERSLKYAGLFILLTFALVWLIEVLGRTRVHAIQYLLLGAALCLFYLLELSLSEHLGFALAYALAGTAVVAMVGGYGWSIFHRPGPATAVAAAVAGLYGYLYVLLSNEDYALLMGSVGLFAILGAIMFATRKIEWSAPQQAEAGAG